MCLLANSHWWAVLPPPMLLQRWFGPVFKSINTAKKPKKTDQKSTHHLESRGCHPSIFVKAYQPHQPFFLDSTPYWFLVGTARPYFHDGYSCYAKTPNWQNLWPRYQIPKVPQTQTTPRLGEAGFFFPSKKGSQSVKSPYNDEKISILENQNWIRWKFGSKLPMWIPKIFVFLILFDADYLLAAGLIIELTSQDQKKVGHQTAIFNWTNTLDI